MIWTILSFLRKLYGGQALRSAYPQRLPSKTLNPHKPLASTLYRQDIIERYRFPRHRGTIADPHAHAEKINAFCGDEIALFLRLDERRERVTAARFEGQGCALMTASADMLCEAVQGTTTGEVQAYAAEDLLRRYGEPPSPGRLACVLLPYEALKSAAALL